MASVGLMALADEHGGITSKKLKIHPLLLEIGFVFWLPALGDRDLDPSTLPDLPGDRLRLGALASGQGFPKAWVVSNGEIINHC